MKTLEETATLLLRHTLGGAQALEGDLLIEAQMPRGVHHTKAAGPDDGIHSVLAFDRFTNPAEGNRVCSSVIYREGP